MYSNKVCDAANLAHYAVRAWKVVGFERRGGAVSVTTVYEMFPELNRYRARQVQQVMHMLGLVYKSDNGRYYHNARGSQFTDECYWGLSVSGQLDELGKVMGAIPS